MQIKRFGKPVNFLYTLKPTYTFNDRLVSYAEVFGFIYKNDLPNCTINGGVIYRLKDAITVDAAAGFGLNNVTPSYFTIGAAFKFLSTNKLALLPSQIFTHNNLFQTEFRLKPTSFFADVHSAQLLGELKGARLLFAIGKANVTESFDLALQRSKMILENK